MKTFLRITAAVAMATACMAATAQSAGTWSVRLGATRIDPQTSSGWLSTPSFPDTRVDVKANSQLTGGVTYMVTNNWAIDVPMGLPFKHDFVGNGAISGTGKLGRTKVLPATVFAQYRFGEAQAALRPYLGLGVTYSKFFKNRSTAALTAVTGGSPANPTTAHIDNKWGFTAQVGFVWNFSERWFLDVAYYKSFLKTTAHLSSGQSIGMRLNPNVVAVGVGYRF